MPLFAVWQLERVVADCRVLLGYRLLAGFLLCCVWGSLRFSDGDRTSPFSLAIDAWVLRGVSWQTKVSDRGVPFGALGVGLEASFPKWGWALHWFSCLRKCLSSIALCERKSIDYVCHASTSRVRRSWVSQWCIQQSCLGHGTCSANWASQMLTSTLLTQRRQPYLLGPLSWTSIQ